MGDGRTKRKYIRRNIKVGGEPVRIKFSQRSCIVLRNGGEFWVITKRIGAEIVEDDVAVDHARKTGERLASFKSLAEAAADMQRRCEGEHYA